MKTVTPALLSCVLLAAAPVAAQEALDTSALADLMVEACIFDRLDFEGQFKATTEAMASSGLPVVAQEDKTAVYGDPAGAYLVTTRSIDSLSCALRLPAPLGSREVLEDFRTKFGAGIADTFPDVTSLADDNPSPHIDGHDWSASFPGKMHYALALDWGTEDGLTVAIGFNQLYE